MLSKIKPSVPLWQSPALLGKDFCLWSLGAPLPLGSEKVATGVYHFARMNKGASESSVLGMTLATLLRQEHFIQDTETLLFPFFTTRPLGLLPLTTLLPERGPTGGLNASYFIFQQLC